MARKKASAKTNDSVQIEKSTVKEKEIIIDYKIKLNCKNGKQKEFVNSIKDDAKEICIGIGSAGTGKTYLSLATALKLLITENERFKKIYIFVNPCESTHSLSIGFLKGTYEEKIEPYIQNALNNIIIGTIILNKSKISKLFKLTLIIKFPITVIIVPIPQISDNIKAIFNIKFCLSFSFEKFILSVFTNHNSFSYEC